MKRGAFTVLELLVAMTLLAVLVLLLLNMVDGAAALWRNNEKRVDSYREPRAALSIIARDLQNSVTGTNTIFFRINDPSMVPSGALVGSNTARLFFLSSLPKAAQWSANASANKSDLCQVGYFVSYGQTSVSSNAPVNTMNLYRYFTPSDDTFGLLLGSVNTDHYPFPNASTITRVDPKVELLARNIVSFAVNAYSTISQTNPTNNAVSTALVKFVPTTNTARPDIIEVSISAVNQDTAKKLPNQISWSDTNSAPIRENIQTFRTRLHLRN